MMKYSKALAAIMLMTTVIFAVGCKPDNDTNNYSAINNGGGNNGGGSNNGHNYVDLGLPSGTLWATCNVGAKAPEEYGDYFAWGETKPKTTYNWDTYKYCNSDYQLTKYCDDSSYGFTDNLTVLLPEDDAATANWGSGWCMATVEQWQELCDNTTITRTIQDNVNGQLFTADNGKSLFLPAAGVYCDDELHSVGKWGYYVSSSLNVKPNSYGPVYARYLWFGSSSDSYDVAGNSRCWGWSVRPVRSTK